MKTARLFATVLAALALTACAEPGASLAPTVPGVVNIVLDASDDSTGALVLTISGGRVDSVSAVQGAVYSEMTAAGASVLVSGTMAPGAVVARIHVPDVTTVSAYRVSGVEAANRLSFAQRAAGSWQLRAVPAAN